MNKKFWNLSIIIYWLLFSIYLVPKAQNQISIVQNAKYVKDTILYLNDKCSIENVVIIFENKDEVWNSNNSQNWKYVLVSNDTNDTIQYSNNFFPRPKNGKRDKKLKKYDIESFGKIKLSVPLMKGSYSIKWIFPEFYGGESTYVQRISVIDKLPPTVQIVDRALGIMDNGILELKAIWFDKGGCGVCNGAISSYDNCTDSDRLIFSFSNVLPKLENDSIGFIEQFAKYGKVFFNPGDGSIMAEEDYNEGRAHAWLPNKKTTVKRFQAEEFNMDSKGLLVKIFVWQDYPSSKDIEEPPIGVGKVLLELQQ